MIKNIIAALFVLIALFALILLISPKDRGVDTQEALTEQSFDLPENAILYFDESQGVALPLVFENGQILVQVIDGEALLLSRTDDQDVERYVDESGTIEFIIDGDNAQMFIEGMPLFNGNVFEGSLEELFEDIELNAPEAVDPATLSVDLEGGELDLLTGSVWVWQETLMSNDDVFTPENDEFTLTFDTSGMVSGTTDCNNFSGQYGVSADRELSWGPLAMTKMFCEDSQEQMYVDMVSASQFVFFTEDDQLVLLLPFDSGSIIFAAE